MERAIVELAGIGKTFGTGDAELTVLHGVDLCVEPGEYLAIMGPSGSGKSTLMNIIGCLDSPSCGTYLLDGQNVAGLSDDELAAVRNRTIGFVFQNFNLLARETAAANVELPLVYAGVRRRERAERAAEALAHVGLADRADFLPSQLSGGQKQRVAIARAMVCRPRLLLADEPTGALDTASGEAVMELFEQLSAEGATIVMITHDPDIAERAHRVAHIRDGRLSEGGFAPSPATKPETSPAPAPVKTVRLSSLAAEAGAIHHEPSPAARDWAQQAWEQAEAAQDPTTRARHAAPGGDAL